MNIESNLEKRFEAKGDYGFFIRSMMEHVNNDCEHFSWTFLPLINKLPNVKANRDDWNKSTVITDLGFDLMLEAFKKLPKANVSVFQEELEDLKEDKRIHSYYSMHEFFSKLRLKHKGQFGDLIEAGFWGSTYRINEYGETPIRQIYRMVPIFIACISVLGEDRVYEAIVNRLFGK